MLTASSNCFMHMLTTADAKSNMMRGFLNCNNKMQYEHFFTNTYSKIEVQIRIAMAKDVFNKKKNLFWSSMDVKIRKRLVNAMCEHFTI